MYTSSLLSFINAKWSRYCRRPTSGHTLQQRLLHGSTQPVVIAAFIEALWHNPEFLYLDCFYPNPREKEISVWHVPHPAQTAGQRREASTRIYWHYNIDNISLVTETPSLVVICLLNSASGGSVYSKWVINTTLTTERNWTQFLTVFRGEPCFFIGAVWLHCTIADQLINLCSLASTL